MRYGEVITRGSEKTQVRLCMGFCTDVQLRRSENQLYKNPTRDFSLALVITQSNDAILGMSHPWGVHVRPRMIHGDYCLDVTEAPWKVSVGVMEFGGLSTSGL